MRTNFIRENLTVCAFVAVSLLFNSKAVAQAPMFRFQHPTLISGTDRQVNALYRFPNVTTGVDALVRVQAISLGMTLQNIDRTADGYSEAFQPEYRISANNLNGYIDFKIDFVKSGTSTLTSVPMLEASALDIDGSTNGLLSLKEFNTVDLGGGIATFDLTDSHIVMSQLGTAFTGRNITGFLYGALVDTSASQVMFSVIKTNVTSFTYRVGASTLLTSASTRYASLYFKRFTYNTESVLAVPGLRSFNGVADGEQTNLRWSLNDNNKVSSITLERSENGKQFNGVAEFWVNMEGVEQKEFKYTDLVKNASSAARYYRLKVMGIDNKISYSEILRFSNEAVELNQLKVFPSQVTSAATVQFRSAFAQSASFELVDYSGRVVYRQPVTLMQGDNNIRVANMDGIPAGNYISTLRTAEKTYSFKISRM